MPSTGTLSSVDGIDYTITFEIEEDVSEDEIKIIINNALIAYANVQIESTTIESNGGVIVVIRSNNADLTGDIIEREVEEELENEYDADIDVDVEVNDSKNDEEESFVSRLLQDTMLLSLIILAVLLLFAIIIILILLRRNCQKNNKAIVDSSGIEMEITANDTVLSKTVNGEEPGTVGVVPMSDDEEDNANDDDQDETNDTKDNKTLLENEGNETDSNEKDAMYSDGMTTQGDTPGNILLSLNNVQSQSDDEDDALYKKGNATTAGDM